MSRVFMREAAAHSVSPAVLAAVLLAGMVSGSGLLSGCTGSAARCASGTVEVGDECVPTGAAACGAGTSWDEGTKRCVLTAADAAVAADTSVDTGSGVTPR